MLKKRKIVKRQRVVRRTETIKINKIKKEKQKSDL